MEILIIHQIHNTLEDILKKNGHKVDTILGLSREKVLEILPKYDGLIVRSALKVDKEVIDAGIKLKFVGRLGAGMENIDSEYAAQKGIVLHNAPEGNRSAVGEHAVGMLLSLYNNLNKADQEVRQGIWKREENRGEEIQEKTVAIIGYGNMGSAFAQKISGFGATVIAYDKYKSNYGNEYVKEVSLQTVFETADIVSLHTPLQEDTFHMVNTEFINSFNKDITLINTSRGPVVHTSDLVTALENGKVKSACLDVLEFEGLSFEGIDNDSDLPDGRQVKEVFDYLKNADNVLLSPHIGGWTHQSNIRMAQVLGEKIVLG